MASRLRAHSPNHPVAAELRRKGFIPLPRLWVKAEDMPTIHLIAKQYTEQVNDIRGQVRQFYDDGQEQAAVADPLTDREAAWAAFEAARSGNNS